MTPIELRDRITAQFSGHGDRADIWRGFDLVLDTETFLNLGYSRWYQPHFLGSSQRRLAQIVGERLTDRIDDPSAVSRSNGVDDPSAVSRSNGVDDQYGEDSRTGPGAEAAHRRLLDVGCGRGGPAIHLAEQFGFAVTGVDLVPYNVELARRNARARGVHDRDDEGTARFVVGDATALPVAAETMAACTSIDALVYVPDRAGAVSQLADVLVPGGTVVVSDLLRRRDLSERAAAAVEAFADAWDMPSLGTVDEYRRHLTDAGFDRLRVESLTAHSVGRFRRWTAFYLAIAATPLRRVVDALLSRYGLDPASIHDQIRCAHEALPHLEHVLFTARA